MNRFIIHALAGVGLALASHSAQAMPLGSGIESGASATRNDGLIEKVWHSGMPHRRIVGNRVYGGDCPPQGCPAWSQRDLAQDPSTGEWFSPYNERQRAVNPYYGQQEVYRPRRRY